MPTQYYPILFAVAAAVAVWSVARAIAGMRSPEKRRLAQRLVSEATVNADPRLRTIVVQTEAPLPGLLGKVSFVRNLNRRLIQAYPDASITRFLALMAGLATVAFLIVYAMMGSALIALVAGGGAGYLPLMGVNGRRNRRQRLLNQQLPESLDFLARVLRAGHSLSTGLQLMGEELPEPMAAEFRRAHSQHSLGQPVEEALRDTARRIDSTDFAFFVTAVLIQRQTGGDLSEVLMNISGMVRQRLRLVQHVRAVTAEGRLTSYILVAFPIVLFFISYALNPTYAGQLVHTDTGRMLLLVAAGLVITGLAVIRRIVTVRA